MRRLLILILLVSTAANAFAVAPQFWRVRSADEFLGGELEGFAVTSRGELKPAPAVRKLAAITDPFVLSQATAPNGDRFFGTGNEGKVYRLRGTELKVLWTAPEPEIYAAAFRNGALYVGTSPNGKVYRVDPESGTNTVFFDPQQAYIWALDFAGDDLLVATGVDGKLFRVPADGKGKVWYDSSDTHIRSLAVRNDGSVLAGASGKGRIYNITRDGNAHALFDSPLNEITSIHVDANGIGWAAAVSNTLPASAPARRTQPAQQQQQQQQQSGTAANEQKKEGEASAAVEVSFSFDDSATASSTGAAGSSEVYRIDSDGFVETVRKFEREMVYAISAGQNGSVLLATGPNGRVYQLRDGELALIGSVPEKQIVSIVTNPNGNETTITTTNAGAIYRLENRLSQTAEFRSAVKDVERFSRFGNYRIEGRNLGASTVAISFRSGNTRTPDATWSAWTPPQSGLEGGAGAPAGRYLQWKVTMPKATPETAIENVTVAFINRNVAPDIDAVVVQDPAVVYISSAYPAAPQVVEVTNPDEYGIFNSIDTPRERTGADQGKRMFRKGFRTVSWRARDDNNDTLRYTVEFRRKGSERWLRLRENIEESQINFDTSQLPDGRYELRLTASDHLDNPDMPLTDVKEAVEFEVDNTAPKIAYTMNGDEVTVRLTDDASAVGRVEYSADAEKWVRLTPVDGLADSRSETVRLKRGDVAGKFVIVRVVDAFFNVATESIELK